MSIFATRLRELRQEKKLSMNQRMTESESVALPLGDTPINVDCFAILAKFFIFFKCFCTLLKKILRTRRKRQKHKKSRNIFLFTRSRFLGRAGALQKSKNILLTSQRARSKTNGKIQRRFCGRQKRRRTRRRTKNRTKCRTQSQTPSRARCRTRNRTKSPKPNSKPNQQS